MKPMPDKLIADGDVLIDKDGITLADIGRNLYPPDYDCDWKEKFAREIASRYNLGAK